MQKINKRYKSLSVSIDYHTTRIRRLDQKFSFSFYFWSLNGIMPSSLKSNSERRLHIINQNLPVADRKRKLRKQKFIFVFEVRFSSSVFKVLIEFNKKTAWLTYNSLVKQNNQQLCDKTASFPITPRKNIQISME